MPVPYKEYLPRMHCLAFFNKDELWRHEKNVSRKEQRNIQAQLLLYLEKIKVANNVQLKDFVL